MVMAVTQMEHGLTIQLMYVKFICSAKKIISLSFASYLFQIGGISVANQSFAIVSSAKGFSNSPRDGLLGMGYQKLTQGGETPVIWSMFLAGELSLPIFCFWFGP